MKSLSQLLQPHRLPSISLLIHGIFPGKGLEWVPSPLSRGSFQLRDGTPVFCCQASSLPTELLGSHQSRLPTCDRNGFTFKYKSPMAKQIRPGSCARVVCYNCLATPKTEGQPHPWELISLNEKESLFSLSMPNVSFTMQYPDELITKLGLKYFQEVKSRSKSESTQLQYSKFILYICLQKCSEEQWIRTLTN